MPARVQIIAGPARSGKTAALLARYRDVLGRPPIGGGLWLAPTHRAAGEVRKELIAGTARAVLQPGIVTFGQYALRVVAATGGPAQPLSPLAKRELLYSLLDEAQDRGVLRYFAPVAQTTGMIEVLARFVSELKRQEIWPEEFAQAAERPTASDKDRELAWLYRRYQEVLLEQHLYDEEGRFWSARTLLRQGATRTLHGVRLAVADGFADFTRTEHDILEIFARHVDELVITLPLPDDFSRRADLFDKPADTLAELRKRHPGAEVTWQRAPAEGWPAVRHLEQHLFVNPRLPLPPAEMAGVEVIAAAQPLGEVRRIAARIKRLLTQGDPATGERVRPEDVAVVYRGLAEAAPLVREVFAEFGIPTAVVHPELLRTAPVLKALTALLRLERGGWAFRDLLAVIGQTFVRPELTTDDGEHRSLSAAKQGAERIVRHLQLPRGREHLLRRVQDLAAQTVDDEPLADDARLARPLLAALERSLAVLPEQAAAADWAAALSRLATSLGLLPAPRRDEPVEVAADRAAWEQLTSALETWEQVVRWTGGTTAPLTRDELGDLVDEILDATALNSATPTDGRVLVLPATQARTLRIPYLFLAGLSEQAFPQRPGEDPLYDEPERGELAAAGLSLPRQRQQACGEMLLFYELVTRATRRLVLSYPATNDKAEPLLPSSYLTEVERISGPGLTREEASELSPLPRDLDPLCPGDQRVLAVYEALEGRPGILAGWLQAPASRPVATNVLRALTTYDSRDAQEFGPFDGRLTTNVVRGALAERFDAEHIWSASQLESYATCAFRFFAERVLRVMSLDELELADDYARRGQWLHEVLAKAHRRLNDSQHEPSAPVAELAAEFRQGFREQLAALAATIAHDATSDATLRRLDLELLDELVDLYLQQYAEYDAKLGPVRLRPTLFEVVFGESSAGEFAAAANDDANERAQSTAVPPPLNIRHAGGVIRVSGRIDRIDVAETDAGKVFSVIDYKSGRPQSKKPAKELDPRRMQLELYLLAVEQLALAGTGAAPHQAGYWFLKDGGFTLHLDAGAANAAWAKRKAELQQTIGELVAGIRGGEFPANNLDENCTGQCPYSKTCRIHHVRARKQP